MKSTTECLKLYIHFLASKTIKNNKITYSFFLLKPTHTTLQRIPENIAKNKMTSPIYPHIQTCYEQRNLAKKCKSTHINKKPKQY